MASDASAVPDDAFDNVTASPTSDIPVQITNAISVAACLAVVISYFFFRRKNPRLMQRTSLVLAVSMASVDLLLHAINLFGYSDLPDNFICSFFGGFLYAFPTLTSLFYSFCIALNTQLVFVWKRRPGPSKLKYYVGVPILLSLLICIPALGVGLYGYDASFDMCWYKTEGKTSHEVLLPYLFTFALWCLLTILYLILAAISITYAVFWKNSRLNHLANNLSKTLSDMPNPPSSPSAYAHTRTYDPAIFSQKSSESDTEHAAAVRSIPVQQPQIQQSQSQRRPMSVIPPRNETLSRRSLAMRALAFRLLGYITIPTLCILPGVIDDLISKAMPWAIAGIPGQLSTFFDSLNGLVGLFNAILYAMDPALLALYHQMWQDYQERKHDSNLELGTADQGGDGNVEVRTEAKKPRFAVPFSPGTSRHSHRTTSGSVVAGGIMIRVEVQADWDNDIDRLQDYLVGL
ncbi:hypothetical protein M408DRAFT_330344 [Serendipita vermifera MAFF 305830]|uniref:G-protein coupled receptors family 2 profile 2 domain-containing protein n=1 Tax=Serendipita vermifera MAFF 305830 TaxID=933852 RepID=A0A0C2XD09_SERVB|nr:hypothetical protein M408DRAFT_330344 [Serendipita vermifera MAFF 305830]